MAQGLTLAIPCILHGISIIRHMIYFFREIGICVKLDISTVIIFSRIWRICIVQFSSH